MVRNSRISATWLSDEMARALAAMWPPLAASDVMRAADELSSQPAPSLGIRLLRDGGDQDIHAGVVEALSALRDLVG